MRGSILESLVSFTLNREKQFSKGSKASREAATVKVASFPNFDKKLRLKTNSRSSLGMEGETKRSHQGGQVIPGKGELEKRNLEKERTRELYRELSK